MAQESQREGTFALPKNIIRFDPQVLKDLVDDDPEVYSQLALIFVDSFETALANMDNSLSVGDRDALGAMGHRAKSTARAIGAMVLGDACEKLERIANTAPIDEVRCLTIDLHSMFEAIRLELCP